MILPEKVNYIINTLHKIGFEAFAVGGCVRDSLMGNVPKDWDITTSAKPDEIKAAFKKTADTGIKHGTVTVILNHEPFEVTTFRRDGDYKDHRRPESVRFVDDITLDLARRDFTVNAMAYNEASGIVDPFGGQEDLKKRLIRCVGDADTRFNEDALRIMRALRFSSVLSFDIDEKTAKSVLKNKNLLENIAKERIFAELSKLLDGDRCNSVLEEFACVFKVFNSDFDFAKVVNKDKSLRLIAFFDSKNARKNMRHLKLPNKTVSDVLSVLENDVPETLKEAQYLCGRIGISNLKNLLLYNGKTTDFADEIEKNKLCCCIEDLHINGTEIMELTGTSGKDVGILLKNLLDAVINGDVENTEAALKNYIPGRK